MCTFPTLMIAMLVAGQVAAQPLTSTNTVSRALSRPVSTNGVSLVEPLPDPGEPHAGSYYLAPRTDGLDGRGSSLDPFNASTPDRLYQSWQKAVFVPGELGHKTIVFMPGNYTVTNELRLAFETTDLTVSGYGARLTFSDKALEGQRTVLSTAWTGNDRVTFEGFTIDCGTAVKFAGPGKVCGIFSRGANNVVRNVTILNCATSAGEHESFGIILQADGGICSGNVVAGTAGSNGVVTGITIEGTDSTLSASTVDLHDNSGTNGMTTFGYSLYGSRLVMSGNTARRVDAGIAMDGAGGLSVTNAWADNVVSGNQLFGNVMAVRIENNSQQYLNWVWTGNSFSSPTRWLSMWTGEQWRANKISGHRFVSNDFAGRPSAKQNLILQNFLEPHSFIGNRFGVKPVILFGAKDKRDVHGTWNTVGGKNVSMN